MASKKFTLHTIFLLLILIPPSLASFSPSKLISPDTICHSTLYPFFCKSILPHNESAGTINDYGRISILRSLSKAKIYLSLINWFLRFRPPIFSKTTHQALEDCKLLFGLNMEFLSTTAEAINISTTNNNSTLQHSQAYDLQTLLSAALTNQQTCLDGLQSAASAWSINNGLFTSLSNGTQLYSVSLALFTQGWVPGTKSGRQLRRKLRFSDMEDLNDHGLPFKMSRRSREVYESVSGRKLFQTSSGDNVRVTQVVVVNPNGSGDFRSISDAVAAAPNNTGGSSEYFMIYVVAGVYEESVYIPKNKQNLMMIGDGINQTVITGNRSVVDGWTTFNSATLAVVGQGFVAVNITIRNTAGAIKQQAVALRNGADMSAFYSCSMEGYQDTLYAHSLRQYYRNCNIYGTVDFIFGNAAVVLQNCNIYLRLPMPGQFNAVTAQGRTDPNQNTGTSIHNCSIIASDEYLDSNNGTASYKTYLGRPWKEYSRTVIMQSFISDFIDASGWTEWSGDFALATLIYGEFNNSGPGSDTGKRISWPGYHVMNETDAVNFTVSNFISGDEWLPSTGVPYSGGLL